VPKPPNVPVSSSRRTTILVVDDDPGVTATFARMLDLEGYDVRIALEAKTGLRHVEACRPDAILLDLRMPLVDGLAFLRELRTIQGHESTPVAIVTGDYWLDDDMTRALRELGATIHFKPLWLEDLVRLTRQLVPL
jgi:two-component system response regulator MprA